MNTTYTLNAEQQERLDSMRKDGETPNECISRLIDFGMNQIEYRRKHAKTKYEENKLGRKLLEMASSDPELAVKLGLGKRVAL
jgi:NAD-specific glutamate dehydrogenase